MPILPNESHEKFAQLLATGKKQGVSYQEVYGKSQPGAASRLANSGPIQTRIKEIRKERTSGMKAYAPPAPPVEASAREPLDHAQHEKFAQLLARDMPPAKAYQQAGFNADPKAASNLAAMPRIENRRLAIKDEMTRAITRALEQDDEEDTAQTLAEMGITLSWIGRAYKTIYKDALAANQFGAANTAVASLHKMVEIERRVDETAPAEAQQKPFEIASVLDVLREVRMTAEAFSKTPRADDDEPRIRDITPAERDETKPFPLLQREDDE